jgi:hypothetical protein
MEIQIKWPLLAASVVYGLACWPLVPKFAVPFIGVEFAFVGKINRLFLAHSPPFPC